MKFPLLNIRIHITLHYMHNFIERGALQWRHNEHDGVSNHRCLDCLLNRSSDVHQSSTSLVFVRGPVDFPHKGPVTRKMFQFDDVIMRKIHVCVWILILLFQWSFSKTINMYLQFLPEKRKDERAIWRLRTCQNFMATFENVKPIIAIHRRTCDLLSLFMNVGHFCDW